MANEMLHHNNPPFDPAEIVDLEILPAQLREAYKFKFDRAAELVKAAEAWLASYPSIDKPEVAANATDRLAQLKAEIDACHGKPGSVHTLAKEPFLKGGRIVDAVLNAELADPMRKVTDKLTVLLKAYHEHLAAEAKRMAQEEAARIQAAAQAAAEAAARRPLTDDELEQQMMAEQEAAEAAEIAARATKPALVRGDYGTSSGLRGKWKARIADVDKIPRQYMMPNVEMIGAALKTAPKDADGRPSLTIPGVEFYFETTLATRR